MGKRKRRARESRAPGKMEVASFEEVPRCLRKRRGRRCKFVERHEGPHEDEIGKRWRW